MYQEYPYIEHPYILIPYTPEIPEARSDTHMMEAYYKLRAERLYEIVFHDNPTMTMGRYMAWFNTDRVLAQFIFKRNEKNEPEEMVGLIWLSQIEHCGDVRRGGASFVVFREFQDGKTPMAVARLGLKYWFDCLGMDVITGATPTHNKAACKFVKRVGMKEVGCIPKYANYITGASDVMITYMNRGMWENAR